MSAYELTKTILKDSANLKAYYRFESGALTTDSSGNSRTLTNVNTVTSGTGVYGGSADFESTSSQYFKIAAASVGDLLTAGSITISTWFKPESVIDARIIGLIGAGETQAANAQYNLALNIDGSLTYLHEYGAGTNESKTTAAGVITAGVWHHIAVVKDATNKIIRFYVNGSAVSSQSYTNQADGGTTANLYIGIAEDETSLPLDGMLDDLAIFTQVLSADQIKELYEGRYLGEWLPQSNLVGLWHLNGNSTDSSGNHNHGTDTSVTYSLANGKIAQGGDFDGTNSKITVANSTSLQVGQASAFTLMAWVQTDVNNTQKYIINKQSATANMFTYNLSMSSGGKPVFGVSKQGVAANDATGNTTLSTGVWHHLTGVSDGSNLIIYLNGASDGTSTISFTSATTNTSSLYFGQLYNDTLRWNGRIDEVAIFSRALTAAEIRHWYAWSVGKYL